MSRTHPLKFAQSALNDKGRLLLINDIPHLSTTNISFSLTERDLMGIVGRHDTEDVTDLFGAQNEVHERVLDEYTLVGQHRGGQLRLTVFFPEVHLFDGLRICAAYAHELIPLLNDEDNRRSFVVTLTTTHLIAEPRELQDFVAEYMEAR